MPSQAEWDARYLKIAREVSMWSRDPSTKTGAVLTKRNRPLGMGYNGMPEGVLDSPKRWQDRDRKIKEVVHCEINAMIFAGSNKLRGATLYTWPFMSCSPCSSIMVQAGVTRFVAPFCDNPRWNADFLLTIEKIRDKNLTLVLYDIDGDVFTPHHDN